MSCRKSFFFSTAAFFLWTLLLSLTFSVYAQTNQEKALQANKYLNEALQLSNQGTDESARTALLRFEEARKLFGEIEDKQKEAECLVLAGSVNSLLGNSQQALRLYNQALPIIRLTGDKKIEALTLNNIGAVYKLQNNAKALEFFNESLSLIESNGDKDLKALILNNVGAVYQSLGENQKAIDYLTQALIYRRSSGDKKGEAETLKNIGLFYQNLGDYFKALDLLKQSLSLNKTIGNKRGEASVLNVIAGVYLNQYEVRTALNYYNQALSLNQEIGNKNEEIIALIGIGATHLSIGKMLSGNRLFIQYQVIPAKEYKIPTFGKVLIFSTSFAHIKNTFDLLIKALSLSRQVGNKNSEAKALYIMGGYFNRSLKVRLDFFNEALTLYRLAENKSGEAITLASIQNTWWELGNPQLAVWYGKQSVNKFQELRKSISGFDNQTQTTYLKTIESPYRELYKLLIARGRISEAEQVLEMLKEEEYFRFIRRDDKVAKELKGKISLSPAEAEAFRRYEEVADKITALGKEYGDLQAESKNFEAGKFPKQARLDELEKQIADAAKVFNTFLDDLKDKFKNDSRVAAVDSGNQALLKEINQPGTVIISTIIGEDKLNLVVTTADTQRAHTVDVKAAELNKLISDFRVAVRNPKIDPRPIGKKLYGKLFPGSLQKDLENIKARTIIWSLDGTLRYVPMSALYDGDQYLVEKYN